MSLAEAGFQVSAPVLRERPPELAADPNREISNVANALAEQTAWTWQAVDLLLIDTARWYQEDALKIPAGDIDSVLAHRTAGTWVRLITITDAHGIQRHRSQGVAPPDLNLSDRD